MTQTTRLACSGHLATGDRFTLWERPVQDLPQQQFFMFAYVGKLHLRSLEVITAISLSNATAKKL